MPDNPMDTVNWNTLWQAAQARHREGADFKGPDFWNGRAREFAAAAQTDFPDQCLGLIDTEPSWTVLDLGCGPGTLALPLAGRVRSVTAMDFSSEMLAVLEERSRQHRIRNIRPVLAGLTDDWERLGIAAHDLLVACRSLTCGDLSAMLAKLHRYARKKVIIVTRVNPGPTDPRILKAAGREFHPGPDYIVILNLLYQMGIPASVDFTIHPRPRTFESHEDAMASCRWMVRGMTAEEETRLIRFFKTTLVREGKGWVLPSAAPVRWAVITWDTCLAEPIDNHHPQKGNDL